MDGGTIVVIALILFFWYWLLSSKPSDPDPEQKDGYVWVACPSCKGDGQDGDFKCNRCMGSGRLLGRVWLRKQEVEMPWNEI